ncbi:hypothetical protein ACH5RR_000334 [Cinchona calisaya]|uniref:Uncharacterized protein n=1 Tax=Cinchona calisaya TaxID=153742 RepID=A0ABD3B0T8_9GENT
MEPSEAVVELGSSSSSGSRYPCTILGFFPVTTKFRVNNKFFRVPISFIYSSEEGKALNEGRWGNLDESLSFLSQDYFDVVGSSNGFLLCRIIFPYMDENIKSEVRNMHHIICNPVTRQFRWLPKPPKPAFHAHIFFICKGDNVTSLDEVYYEVVRAGQPNSQIPFAIGDVIFWNVILGGDNVLADDSRAELVAYDDRRGAKLVRTILIEVPKELKYNVIGDFFGHFDVSEGKIQQKKGIVEDYKASTIGDYFLYEWPLAAVAPSHD